MNALRLLRSGALLVATLAPLAATAATRFDFTTEVTGYTYSGRMAIDGLRSRVDITEGNHPLFNPGYSILTRGGGKEIVVLDHAQRTYFVRHMTSLGGHLATARGIGRTTASRPRVKKTKVDDRTFIVHASYELVMEVEGEKLNGTVELDARFEIDPKIEQRALPWGLQFGAKTGFEDVDDALAARIPDRLPLRQVVSVSRRIADGPVVTESITTTISNVRTEAMSDDDFLAPEGYRYQEPVFNFGG
ncbi:MAG TPA: hypothetical protein VJZ00_22870 [Thermoanaerobaculia bacterium]|nr:hypothetical protein [Thermoanaerobaculia bacterium]